MTDETRKAVKDMLERKLNAPHESAADARQSLIKSGIYSKDGKLKPEYGGERKTA